MRFMLIVKASKDSEAGVMPSNELIAAMTKFNEEMVNAGILMDGAGLQPSSKGARVKFTGNKVGVVDGPFAETKELIAGYWIINVKSRQEAIDWAKRSPNPQDSGDGEIEVRPFYELADFPPREAVDEARELEKKFRQKE